VSKKVLSFLGKQVHVRNMQHNFCVMHNKAVK